MADAVPGVSGGTIALILGIYNKLIFSLSDFLNFFKIFYHDTPLVPTNP